MQSFRPCTEFVSRKWILKKGNVPWVHVLQMGKTLGVVNQKRKDVEDEIKRQKANKLRTRELERPEDYVTQNVKCGRKTWRWGVDDWEDNWDWEDYESQPSKASSAVASHAAVRRGSSRVRNAWRTPKERLRGRLPQLKVAPIQTNSCGFVNVLVTQIDHTPISDEEKFGYLLESVGSKVREKIANRRTRTMG